MGISASLFFRSNDSEAQTLIRRITIAPEQFEKQQERWNDLAEHLVSDLKSRSTYPIQTWLQGSYKFGTQVRPPNKREEFDIDLGVYFCWSGQADSGASYPQDLMEFTQDSLKDYKTKDRDVLEVIAPPKTRCSRIRYKGGFHIDVPSYHLEPEIDERTLAAQSGWEISDPKAIYKWFTTSLDEARRPIARRIIKYLKCWAGLRWSIDNGRPTSIMLTVMATDAVGKLDDDLLGIDDDALASALKHIVNRVEKGSFVRNPVNPSENLNRLSVEQWNAFVSGIIDFSGIAEDAIAANTLLEAADLWTRAFQQFFPMPDVEDDHLRKASVATGGVPAVINVPDVDVEAVSDVNRNVRFSGVNRIGPIPKNCTISFTLRDPWKLPPGSIVEWMVRNEGTEAEEENDLGHIAASGFQTIEHSAYKGTHYMDCILRQSGRAIAVRRVEVQVSGMPVPPRNQPRRPAYVRLRGRR